MNALLDVHLVVVYKVSQCWMLQLVHSKEAVGITGGINEEMFTSFHRPIGEHVAFDFLTDPDQKTPWYCFIQKLFCFLRRQDTC